MAKKPFDYDGDGKANTEQDKAMADKDINKDGVINKDDTKLKQDTLSMDVLGVDYAFAMKIVAANPEVQKTFEDAIAHGWSKEKFQASLKSTNWYNDQGTEYARTAWFAKQEGGGQWEDQLSVARDAVKRAANAAGAVLPENQIDAWAEKYLFQGWYRQDRQGLMADSFADLVDIQKGGASTLADKLRQIAGDNGVSVSDKWLTDVAQSVTAGKSSSADWSHWIQEQAANKNPLYADRIRQGVSLRSLVSPYTSRMSSILGISESDIKLDDPLLSQAIGQVDEKGNPKAMNFSDFETKLRNDPRWETSTNGANTLMDMATRMTKSWGFVN